LGHGSAFGGDKTPGGRGVVVVAVVGQFALAGCNVRRRVLELGAEPAHQAAGFFGGAFGVQCHQPFEDGLVERAFRLAHARRGGCRSAPCARCFCFGWDKSIAHRVRSYVCGCVVAMGNAQQRQQIAPAIGIEHGCIDLVVQLAQHRDQAMLVDHPLLRGQRLAAAQLVQHVVHAGEGDVGVGGLLALAVGVELFGLGANAGLLFIIGDGEREGLEATIFVVTRPVFKCAPLWPMPKSHG
jgi:hypothetical protein